MEPLYREYRTVDKRGWQRGPWDAEPDKAQWVDEPSGLDCLIVRNSMGALCGYVGVPESHPWFKVDYNRCTQRSQCVDEWGGSWCNHSPEALTSVHGGITYSDVCQEGAEDAAICHLPFAGRPEHVWWFGFDCAHSGDLIPGYPAHFSMYSGNDTYKDTAYVRGECTSLAQQLASVTA